MFTRRLFVSAAAALGLLTLSPLPPASAASRTLAYTLAPAWGTADIKIVRTGWTVIVNGHLTDTRADGDCLYVEAVLEVDHWADPDSRIPHHCDNRGTRIFFELPALEPDLGSKLSRIRVRLCAADALKDSCKERTDDVPAERAAMPQYKNEIDGYMNTSMADFKQARAQAPQPFNWTSDGCSKPAPDKPQGFNFKDACDRHDFGYRNYGKGSLRAAPTDAQRAEVDARLKGDLMNVCDGYREHQKCRSIAQTYYDVLRKAGGKAFYS